jgi:alpha-D-ribose 1-methylphosphonate 5-triphosphate synthase subunit PhnI
MGEVSVGFTPDELGFEIELADLPMTECIMLSGFAGSAEQAPQYTRGYGLTFGHNERKAMSMSIVDRALRGRELGEEGQAPCQDEEFVLYHSDVVEASGFVQHLKRELGSICAECLSHCAVECLLLGFLSALRHSARNGGITKD